MYKLNASPTSSPFYSSSPHSQPSSRPSMMIYDSGTSSKAGHIVANTMRRRSLLFGVLAIVFILLMYPFSSTYLLPAVELSPSEPLVPEPEPEPQVASSPSTSAYELLNRPISSDRTSIPKIIHQTWFPAGTNMSESAQQWVATVKAKNPDWEYVLWDDESDELLVKKYFPWFLETYRQLPQEINRADMVRNFYMYLFGGMYLDVDTEALRPINSLFVSHDVHLRPHKEVYSADHAPDSGTMQRAFMGRMAHTLDPEGLGAIPNGWMASPPGHPFWLLPVLNVLENPKGDGSVEGMTGPGILGPIIKQYNGNGRQSLRRQLCHRVQTVQPTWDLYCPQYSMEDIPASESLKHSLILLPREQVYPYSWVDDGEVKACLGAKSNPKFDPEECKRRMDVDAWPSYFITYCTHTW